MRIAVTGSRGQLGSELEQVLMAEHEVIPMDLPDYDITDLRIIATIEECQPDVVIHCAAMTNVDGCTRDPTAAYLVNALGTRNVALGCQRAGAEMSYISTNEVFDGTKLSYLEFDEPNPINTYGKSKLAGERFVLSLLDRFYIIRTSWLFGGGNNFVRKIISLADAQGELKVVTDEVSSPTNAQDLARAIGRLLEHHVYGVYHLVNAGACSRYEYARRILEMAGRGHVPVYPITLADFKRASTPPSQSYLENFCGKALGIALRPWEEALAAFLAGEAGK